MLTLDAFSSLSQLGAGIGLTLTVFVEPISLREKRLKNRLKNDLVLISDTTKEPGITRASLIWQKSADLDLAARQARKIAGLPMLFVKAGAALNLLLLLFCTVAPMSTVSLYAMYGLLAISILPISIGTVGVIAIAYVKIGSIERDYVK